MTTRGPRNVRRVGPRLGCDLVRMVMPCSETGRRSKARAPHGLLAARIRPGVSGRPGTDGHVQAASAKKCTILKCENMVGLILPGGGTDRVGSPAAEYAVVSHSYEPDPHYPLRN